HLSCLSLLCCAAVLLDALPVLMAQDIAWRDETTAQRLYEAGVKDHNPKELRKLVDQPLAGKWRDKALLALGDMAFESGNFAAARYYWKRVM
ncbi:MAG: hypothetical protein ACWGMZ_05745, partial [Thermoguttaceae bacterium]